MPHNCDIEAVFNNLVSPCDTMPCVRINIRVDFHVNIALIYANAQLEWLRPRQFTRTDRSHVPPRPTKRCRAPGPRQSLIRRSRETLVRPWPVPGNPER